MEFQTLYQELVEDEVRNRRICDDVIESANNGRSPLVLTERNDHLDRLESLISAGVRHLVVLRAGLGKKQRQAVTERLTAIPRDEARVILATGKYVGEGFDDSRLDTLFLTLPVSWRGTVAQYAGRLHRLCEGKREVRIYDCADLNVPMLARMFDRRCRGYEAVGYQVLLPASPYRAGPPMSFFRRTRYGSGTTPAACADLSAMASMCRSPVCSSTPLARCLQMPMAPTEREVRRKPFCIGAWKRWRRQRGVSASTARCPSHSMVWEDWKSISYPPTHVSRWNSTARSISQIQSRIGATGVRIRCYRTMDTWCCASSPKTWAANWTWCSMRS